MFPETRGHFSRLRGKLADEGLAAAINYDAKTTWEHAFDWQHGYIPYAAAGFMAAMVPAAAVVAAWSGVEALHSHQPFSEALSDPGQIKTPAAAVIGMLCEVLYFVKHDYVSIWDAARQQPQRATLEISK